MGLLPTKKSEIGSQDPKNLIPHFRKVVLTNGYESIVFPKLEKSKNQFYFTFSVPISELAEHKAPNQMGTVMHQLQRLHQIFDSNVFLIQR